MKSIERLKKKVKQNGGDTLGDDEFDKIMNKKDPGGSGKKKAPGVLSQVKDKHNKKNQFKAKGGKGHFKGSGKKQDARTGKKRTINQPRSKNGNKRQKSKKGIV